METQSAIEQWGGDDFLLKDGEKGVKSVEAAVEDVTPESEHELQALQYIMEVPEEA